MPDEPREYTNLGGLDKPKDPRDVMLGAAAPKEYTYPPTYKTPGAWGRPIEDQGDEPACGAHAGTQLKGLRKGGRFSPRATWGDLKSFDGWPIEQGTDIRSIFKSITKTGVADFPLYGNDVSLPSKEYAKALPKEIRDAMAANAGDGYGFITDLSWDGLKQFISDHGPTIILLRVGKEWWTDKNGKRSHKEKDILPIRPPKEIVSGHFIVAHDYDEENIYFMNWWGDGWGRLGHGWFQKNYMPFVNDAGALFPLKFKKDLSFGMMDPDVKRLQIYLNERGFKVAVIGPGSPGKESDFFGALTQNALKKFQAAKGIAPAAGYFGPLTRAWIETHA